MTLSRWDLSPDEIFIVRMNISELFRGILLQIQEITKKSELTILMDTSYQFILNIIIKNNFKYWFQDLLKLKVMN